MSNSGVQGTRVAETIGIIKWVMIAFSVGWGVVAIMYIQFQTDLSRTYEIVSGIAAALSALFFWVLFGWFEHTLLALVAITRNTTPAPVGVEWTREIPPAPYEANRA